MYKNVFVGGKESDESKEIVIWKSYLYQHVYRNLASHIHYFIVVVHHNQPLKNKFSCFY